MSNLEPPDAFALSAALGWIELGNPTEALVELDRVAPASQSHPGVLQFRWAALAELKRWPEALVTAADLVRAAPDNVSGWLHQAYALRRVPTGGLTSAWEALRPAADRFANEPVVAFNLACYATQMQQLDDARFWLKQAFKRGDAKEIKQMALSDADLKPLWAEIESWD